MIGPAVFLLTLMNSGPAATAERATTDFVLAARRGAGPVEAAVIQPPLEEDYSGSPFAVAGNGRRGSTMLGTVPLADGLNLGVGLFSIIHQSDKEVVRGRTHPSREIRPRDGRVAAVGMSLRF